jgi:hypothetical protein
VKKRLFASCALTLCTLLLAFTPVMAQAGQTAPAKPIPRMPDGKPDMSGVWAGPGFKFVEGKKNPEINIGAGGIANNLPPFVPGGEALFNLKKTGDVKHDNPQLLCVPHGMPRVALSSHAQQFIQGRTHLAILYENDHIYRPIPMDGRPHSEDLDPFGTDGTFMGNARGHWEGDTLIVDTVGIRPGWLDARDHMHTEALHLTERFTMTAADRIKYELTIDDPKIFTKPFTHTWEMRMMPDWEIEEFICEDNNKDLELIKFLDKK